MGSLHTQWTPLPRIDRGKPWRHSRHSSRTGETTGTNCGACENGISTLVCVSTGRETAQEAKPDFGAAGIADAITEITGYVTAA